jgi:Spy/CpxP family protein refolding chaperone
MRMGIIGVLLALAASAAAKPENLRDRVREKIRVLRIARLVEALDLDERTATRFMPLVNKTYDDIGEVARDAGEARRNLRRLLDAGSNDVSQINALVDRLVADKLKIDQLENELFREVRKVLGPAQVGRLVLVLPEINREIQQQIRRAAKGDELPP